MVESVGARERLIDAAIESIQAEGLQHLTLRSLGASVHMHHTAIYRYFATKDALLAAVFVRLAEGILQQAASDDSAPSDRVRALCTGLRGMFHSYPGLVAAVVTTAGTLPHAQTFQSQVLSMLRDMGVADLDLATWYQALETHVIGSSYYDFAGAPAHLEQRRQRYRTSADVCLDDNARTIDDIDALNERAFMWALNALLDAAVPLPR